MSTRHTPWQRARNPLCYGSGLSGSGKSTIANIVEKKLHAMGQHTMLLDGDNVRHGPTATSASMPTAWKTSAVSARSPLMLEAGVITLVSFISPFSAERAMVRSMLDDGEFEIFVDTPLEEAERRDAKGLQEGRAGELKNFTGIDSPHEVPMDPEIALTPLSLVPRRWPMLCVHICKPQY